MSNILDCTVISNFAAANALKVLRDVLPSPHISVQVYEEIMAGFVAGYDFYKDIDLIVYPLHPRGWLRMTSMSEAELALLNQLPETLHSGEAASLCIAKIRKWRFLTDDMAARKQAREWKIPLSGSAGVLLFAIETKRITLAQGNTLLAKMIRDAHYRSPVERLDQLVQTKTKPS